MRKVLIAAAARFQQMFRIVEYSVQSNHVPEAESFLLTRARAAAG